MLGALAALGACPATAPAEPREPAAVVALLAPGAEPRDMAAVPGVSPGLMSAGLSTVSAAQTYLDISQGNRIFTSLYPEDLPDSLRVTDRVPGWPAVVKRSDDAPGDLVPGLLAQTLEDHGVQVRVDPRLRTPALLGANRLGEVGRTGYFDCQRRRCPSGVTVIPAHRYELAALVRRLRGEDMLIALERPPPVSRHALAIGIAGRGFDGALTSDTSRTSGLVASTDLAPTILARYGIARPEAMNGRAIHGGDGLSAADLATLGDRLSVISSRRGPVVISNALFWLLAALIAIAIGRGRAARVVLPLLALACAYLPLFLLLGAALEPSRLAERLLVGLGAPLAAGATWALVRGWGALALACGLTAGAYAVDVIAGSPLTKLSLIGPNPVIGVRFFGIGNELEAAIAVLVPVGIGAALAAIGPAGPHRRRTAVTAFLGVGALAAAIFAAGRFGADVGAAIVLPVGAAVAAAVAAGVTGRRRWILLVVCAPLLALAVIAALDLVLGGGAHLTSSVLEAGGAHDLADVAQRRLTLSAKSFGRAADSPFLYLAALGLVLAFVKRDRIRAWFADAPEALAGFCGAAAATIVGTIANDSGAILLMIGSALIASGAGFAWSQAPESNGGSSASPPGPP